MKEVHQDGLSSEAQKARELAWLREHLPAFWVTAYEGYQEEGRGAVVIDTTTEPLGEDTPFYYVPQARFEAQVTSPFQHGTRIRSRLEMPHDGVRSGLGELFHLLFGSVDHQVTFEWERGDPA